MGRVIEKIFFILVAIVFVTFLVRHGAIDFSALDFTIGKAKEIASSDEAQQIGAEVKDITFDVLSDITAQTKGLINKYHAENKKAEATLLDVTDGDTLKVLLEGEEVYVRLIGIDTPESVNPDESKNNVYGALASSHTKQLLDGVNKVYLEFDTSATDQYGRVLAYVWLNDTLLNGRMNIESSMLNGIILKDGYAKDVVYEPNTKYATQFAAIRNDAKNAKAGLWGDEGFVELAESN